MTKITVDVNKNQLDEVVKKRIVALERRNYNLEKQVARLKLEVSGMQDQARRARAIISAVRDAGEWWECDDE